MNCYAENCVAITVPRAEEVTRSLSVEDFRCQDRHHFIYETWVFSTTLFPSIATISVTSALVQLAYGVGARAYTLACVHVLGQMNAIEAVGGSEAYKG